MGSDDVGCALGSGEDRGCGDPCVPMAARKPCPGHRCGAGGPQLTPRARSILCWGDTLAGLIRIL